MVTSDERAQQTSEPTPAHGAPAMTTVRRSVHGRIVEPDRIVEQLRADGHTVGRTRQLVISAVRRRRKAFTAETLAESLPDVHVATVYRTLGLLETIGAVRHVHLSHGPAIYERADADDVRHLVCEVCDRHVSVPASLFDGVSRQLTADYQFTLVGSHFAIVGRCTSCTE